MDKEQRESRAKSLLSDELFNEAFNMLEQDIKDTWYRTSLGDTEARESLWLSLRLLERIRLHLTSIVETGEMAKKLEEYQL
ncbi:hypothetical protein [Mesonia mobilis]|uniref:hypothetical protein n=1 Tax=Mesonia mobilis TaxID=369791 RepID=UPI0026EE7AFB|nr:hypothetical protein [Mesonia mobilis]